MPMNRRRDAGQRPTTERKGAAAAERERQRQRQRQRDRERETARGTRNEEKGGDERTRRRLSEIRNHIMEEEREKERHAPLDEGVVYNKPKGRDT